MLEMEVKGVVVIGQTVRHYLHVYELRRETPQRLYQTCIAIDFYIQGSHDAVIRHAVAVELIVLAFYLLQRITQVESVILFLGIQH